MDKYTVNDFFCGAGGVALGLRDADFDIIWACDFDAHCVKSYSHNVGDYVINADVTKLHYNDIPKADGWAFGFPCQDLSVAGQQKGFVFRCIDCGTEWKHESNFLSPMCPKCNGTNYSAVTRSACFFEIMRLLDETRANAPENYPAFLLAENVKGLRPYIPVLIEELEKRGYAVEYELYNSKYWDVPQNRERYFIVATLKELGKFEMPEEQHEYVPKLSSALDKEVDEKYYIPDEKAQTIIMQAVKRLEELGKIHPCITPDRIEKRQNGRRAKEDEETMFTLTAQDIHGVIIRADDDEGALVGAICDQTGLLNPDGQGKTLRVGGGGVVDKETQLSARFGECVQDGVIQKQRNGHGTFFGVSPTLLSTDYKGPHLLIENKEEQ